jgi:hypothetical protein
MNSVTSAPLGTLETYRDGQPGPGLGRRYGELVVHVLVLLGPAGKRPEVDHEPFVDEMIAANVVVLGGEFATQGEFEAGYLLRTESLAEAEAWVARDPS